MRLFYSLLLIFTLTYPHAFMQQTPAPRAAEQKPAPLPPPRVKIGDYRERAARIIGAALTSDRAYRRLAYLTDRIGHRLSGSNNLERAIQWALAEMRADGLDTCGGKRYGAAVVRGAEKPCIDEYRPHELSLLGLGKAWDAARRLTAKPRVRSLTNRRARERVRGRSSSITALHQ